MKHLKSLLLVALMCWTASAYADYDGMPLEPKVITELNYTDYGLTPANYTDYLGAYVIRDAAHLFGFAELINSYTADASTTYTYVYLTEDIVVNANCVQTVQDGGTPAYPWKPICSNGYYRPIIFDGQGHTISGLYFNNTTASDCGVGGGNMVGLFSRLYTGRICNLGIVDSYFQGYESVGSFAGKMSSQFWNNNSEIVNCYSNAVVRGAKYVGGIIGFGYNSNNKMNVIRNCYFSGSCTGGVQRVGGIAGFTQAMTVANCYNVGSVRCNTQAGAITGEDDGAQISNCFYLEGSARHTNGTIRYGAGNLSLDVAGRIAVATAQQFHSGEVCWRLAGSDNASVEAWYQSLPADTIPQVVGSARVYAIGGAKCDGSPKEGTHYSNTPGSYVVDAHNHVDGLCTVCGHCDEIWMLPAVDGFYEIDTAAKLYWFAAYVAAGHPDADARLTADIVLNTGVLNADGTLAEGDYRMWTPIGTMLVPYAGTFDGQLHTISGLYFNNVADANYPDGGNYTGLFGYVDGATLTRIDLVDGYISGGQIVGGITGFSANTNISRCHNGNTIVSNVYGKAGGIAGIFQSGNTYSVSHSYNTGSVSALSYYGGGIVGQCSGNVSHCYNLGKVKASSDVGAIVGYLASTCMVKSSFYQYGCAVDKYNTKVYGIGSKTADAPGQVDTISSAMLTSGELAWRLNDEKTDASAVWFQNLATEVRPNLHPTGMVYAVGTIHCDGTSVVTYQNTPGILVREEHDYVNHICQRCGHLDPDYSIDPVGDVYQIATAADLYYFAKIFNAVTSYTSTPLKAVLTADIVINENCLATIAGGNEPKLPWTPIGTSSSNRPIDFDGQGHTISGLYFNNTIDASVKDGGGNYAGLFGLIYAGRIANVGILDSYIRGYKYVGSLAAAVNAYNGPLTVENCYSYAAVVAQSYSGGLIGNGYRTTVVNNCYFAGTVSTNSTSFCGAFGGYMQTLTISNCFTIGDAVFPGNYVSSYSSAFGYNDGATIRNCYYLKGSVRSASGAQYHGSTGSSEDVAGQTAVLTAEQFASGEACWRLNGSTNDDTNFHWYQALPADTLPGFVATGSNKVYVNSDLNCDGSPKAAVYANSYHEPITDDHNHVDGLCSVCGHCDETWMAPAADGYYEIGTAAQLYWFAAYVAAGHPAANARLTANIVLNSGVLNADGTLAEGDFRQWKPIGTHEAPYTGTFDGGQYVIGGLYFNNPDDSNYPMGGNYTGLFGYTNGATLKNINLYGGYVGGGRYVGGLVGYADNSDISRCSNGNTVVSNAYGNVGGIAGYFIGSGHSVSFCYNTGRINMTTSRGIYVGGIVAMHVGGDLKSCYSTGEVLGYKNVGGVAGYANPSIVSSSYYSYGKVYQGTTLKYGIGSNSSGDIYQDILTSTDSIHADQLASGEMAWLMNNAAGETVWLQTIGDDAMPYFVGDTIFRVINCPEGYTFANSRSQMHTLVYADKVDPTCTEHGHVAGYTCSVCQKHFEDAEALVELSTVEWTIAMLGHDPVAGEALAATCTEAGHTAGSHCDRCGVEIVPQLPIDPLGHDTVVDAAVAATCTTDGLTAGSHCDRCHTVLVEQETVEALGHDFAHYVYNEDATREADGTETAECEHGCGVTDTRTAEGTRIIDEAISNVLSGEPSIKAHHHTIIIENAAGIIRVFDAAGHLVAETKDAVCHQHVEITLSHHGTYIVRCDNVSAKINL